MSTKKPTKTTTPTPTLKTPQREFENYIGLTPDERKEIGCTLFRAYDQANDNLIASRKFFNSLNDAVAKYKSNHDALALGLEIATLLNNTPDELIARDVFVCGTLNSLMRKLKEKYYAPGTPAHTSGMDSDK